MRIRGLRLVAATLVGAGLFLLATGGSVDFARGLLIGGLLYALLHVVLEWWRGRK